MTRVDAVNRLPTGGARRERPVRAGGRWRPPCCAGAGTLCKARAGAKKYRTLTGPQAHVQMPLNVGACRCSVAAARRAPMSSATGNRRAQNLARARYGRQGEDGVIIPNHGNEDVPLACHRSKKRFGAVLPQW